MRLGYGVCFAEPPVPTFKKLQLTDKFYCRRGVLRRLQQGREAGRRGRPVLVRRARLPEEARDPPAQGLRSQGLLRQLPHLHRRLQRRRLARRPLRAVSRRGGLLVREPGRQGRPVEEAPGPEGRGQRIADVGRHQRRRPARADLQHRPATWATPPTTRPSPTSRGSSTPSRPRASYQRYTHGIGFGDINGDGRIDLVEADGWWEQPASAEAGRALDLASLPVRRGRPPRCSSTTWTATG